MLFADVFSISVPTCASKKEVELGSCCFFEVWNYTSVRHFVFLLVAVLLFVGLIHAQLNNSKREETLQTNKTRVYLLGYW